MIHRIQVSKDRYDTRQYCNIPYTEKRKSDEQLRLHVICPRGDEAEHFPLIIYIGGGGWQTSSPERHLPELAYFASLGYVVASVGYTTTDKSIFPRQIEDVRTAIRYLRKNSEVFHINKKKIVLYGGSAGAYLSAMAALTAGTELFIGDEYKDISDAVSGVIGLYGIYDFMPFQQLAEEGRIEPIQKFLPSYDNETLIKASPVTYVGSKKIPFLLFHGTQDHMVPVDQSVHFYEELVKLGIPAQLYLIDGADHADELFSQPQIQSIVRDYLLKSLGEKKDESV